MTGAVLALSGGVGGAKLALGLAHVLAEERAQEGAEEGAPASDLVVAANTGDDFVHLGLHVSPDVDTLMYVLSDRDDRARGWGRRDESWRFMAALREVGGETWFQLGDQDLALHVERTRRLHAGQTLSAVTQDIAASFGIDARLLPMSDDPVRTRIRTADGWMGFQEWFVGARCGPAVQALAYEGAERARPLPSLLAALADPALRCVIICPSNPLLSIAPMLAMPTLRAALAACRAPVVAVSPIIAGQAVRGPAVKVMRELGLDATAAGVAAWYGSLIGGYVLDEADGDAAPLRLATAILPTLMTTLADRVRVARAALDLADRLRARRVAA